MAVRQHLYGLRDERVVTYEEELRPLGRPAKIWRLLPEADRFFRDGHANLSVSLIDAVRRAFGQTGLDRLLAIWRRRQWDSFRKQIPRKGSPRKVLAAFAAIRSEDGYLVEVRELDDGAFLFIENHCSIREAATACEELCGVEQSILSSVLGRHAKVTRTEHILRGARRCVYRIALN